jgi:pyridoxamine 5'-phosphate oxidase
MNFNSSESPIDSFFKYYNRAEELKIKTANAMQLATVDHHNHPRVRTVLFKGLLRGGFSFYTNYKSIKSQNISFNSNVSAVFFWTEMDVQIRLKGVCEKCTREESEKYFSSRPRESQLGAWASNQSEELQSYQQLELRYKEFEKKFSGSSIPCPEHWGGFIIKPTEMEFWFGKVGRMHERYLYQLVDDNWNLRLLNP